MSDTEWYHFACWLKLTPDQQDKLCSDPLPLMTALAKVLGGEITADNVFLGRDRPELPHVRLGVEARFFDGGHTITRAEEGNIQGHACPDCGQHLLYGTGHLNCPGRAEERGQG